MKRLLLAGVIATVLAAPVIGQVLQGSGAGVSVGGPVSGGAANCVFFNSGSVVTCDTGLTYAGAGGVVIPAGPIVSAATVQASALSAQSHVIGGAVPATLGSCSFGTLVGGKTAGTFVAQGCGPPATAATAMVLSFGALTAPNGWACDTADRTSNLASGATVQALTQNGSTVTGVSFRASTATNDVIQWKCMAY